MNLLPCITLPGSKSMAARLIVMNLLSGNRCCMSSMPKCDDVDVLNNVVHKISSGVVNVGFSGTAMRFLTAAFAMLDGTDVILSGEKQLYSRPIGVLVDALRSIGADIVYLEKEEYPPVRVKGRKIKGGIVNIPANVSSQYISALIIAGAQTEQGIEIRLSGKRIVSEPYIDMTIALVNRSGGKVIRNESVVIVRPAQYVLPSEVVIEPDWSAASYFYEAVALSGAAVFIPELRPCKESLQGDSICQLIFKKFGVESCFTDKGVTLLCEGNKTEYFYMDMGNCPDIVPSVVATSALLGIPFEVTGIEHLCIKESNRLEVLKENLGSLGFVVSVDDCSIKWNGTIKSYNTIKQRIRCHFDHRMLMAMAPAIFVGFNPIPDTPDCITKSFPDFYKELSKIEIL